MRPRRALLVASSALVVAVGGCGGAKEPEPIVTGNLMPPPMHELCVQTKPAGATVTIDAAPLEADGCNQVWQGEHIVDARIEGMPPRTQSVPVLADTELVVDLAAPVEEPAPAPAPAP